MVHYPLSLNACVLEAITPPPPQWRSQGVTAESWPPHWPTPPPPPSTIATSTPPPRQQSRGHPTIISGPLAHPTEKFLATPLPPPPRPKGGPYALPHINPNRVALTLPYLPPPCYIRDSRLHIPPTMLPIHPLGHFTISCLMYPFRYAVLRVRGRWDANIDCIYKDANQFYSLMYSLVPPPQKKKSQNLLSFALSVWDPGRVMPSQDVHTHAHTRAH